MKRTILTLIAIAAAAVAALAQTQYRTIAQNTERWDGAVWLESDSSRYFYAQAKQDTLLYTFDWDEIDMEWEYSFRRYYTFDANGNITQRLAQLWDGTLFTNYEKEDRTFNANNEMTSFTRYSWDGAQWVGVFKETYSFDSQGLETSYMRQTYSTGTWVNDYRYLYTYTGSTLQTSERQEWNGSAWEKISRTVLTHDTAGNITILLVQAWVSSNYVNDYQYIRRYDGQNNLLLDTYCDWVAGDWDSINRTSNTYNTANKLTLYLRQNWNGSSWVNNTREIYTYQPNQTSIDTFLRQRWVSGNWENQYLTNQDYDGDGNHVFSQSFEWMSGAWSPTYRSYLYYEAYQITGIPTFAEALDAAVYPNPFAEALNFKLEVEGSGEAEIMLFDLSGKKLLYESYYVMPGQQLISVSTGNLPNGGYIFVLSIDGKQARGLITK